MPSLGRHFAIMQVPAPHRYPSDVLSIDDSCLIQLLTLWLLQINAFPAPALPPYLPIGPWHSTVAIEFIYTTSSNAFTTVSSTMSLFVNYLVNFCFSKSLLFLTVLNYFGA